MSIRDILVTGRTARLPGDYAPRPADARSEPDGSQDLPDAPDVSAGHGATENGLPAGAVAEYRFHRQRKWRFDWAWPAEMLALEIEGGAWTGGRHTRGKGFLGDMEKYNTAVLAGWRILRVTPQQMASGEAGRLVRLALATSVFRR